MARSKEETWNVSKLTGDKSEENIQELANEMKIQLSPDRIRLDLEMGKFQSKEGVQVV